MMDSWQRMYKNNDTFDDEQNVQFRVLLASWILYSHSLNATTFTCYKLLGHVTNFKI